MFVRKQRIVDFFDVDSTGSMTAQAMARCFQDLAVSHSDQVGAGFRVLRKRSFAWFLNRLKIDILSAPSLHETIHLSTWTRGMKRFKNFREYLMESEDKKPLVKGSSVWLFYDLAQLRIAKVPKDIIGRYEPESVQNFDPDLDDWKPCGKIGPDQESNISLRYSDFDINGHVNNTVYIGFLESLFYEKLRDRKQKIKEISLRFVQEIDPSFRQVSVGWRKQGQAWDCNISSSDTLFADAQIATNARSEK